MKNTHHPCFRLSSVWIVIALLILVVLPVWAQTSLNLTIHSLQAAPISGELAYNVDLYLSILDEEGQPVQNLTQSDFSLSEDGQTRQIELVEVAADTPISLVLLLDTSGSMTGPKLTSAIEAATRFIQRLSSQDQVAVVTFDNETDIVSEFSSDFTGMERQLEDIEATPDGETCLYDATYEAIDLANTLPPGRRAVLVLTDGRDELQNGNSCSTYTVDDVIDHATGGAGGVPVYTLGLGGSIDQGTLERLALLTGGQFLYSSASADLEDMFQQLTDQITQQYHLHYISYASSSTAHTATLRVTLGSLSDQESINFNLPEIPPAISITSPAEGQEVGLQVDVTVELLGQVERVTSVIYEIAGTQFGPVTDAPFNYSLDLSSVTEGEQQILAVALDANGTQLSEDAVTVIIVPGTAVALPTEDEEFDLLAWFTANWLIATIAGVIGLALIVGLFLIQNRRKKDPEPFSSTPGYKDEHTIDDISFGGVPLAIFTVLASDDPLRIGEKVTMTRSNLTIGRSEDCDLSFPKDKPVSRKHALLEYSDGIFTLTEVITIDENGIRKTPTYGTRINGNLLAGSMATLQAADEILLGNRLKLRFDPVVALSSGDSEDKTIDGFDSTMEDHTRDA